MKNALIVSDGLKPDLNNSSERFDTVYFMLIKGYQEENVHGENLSSFKAKKIELINPTLLVNRKAYSIKNNYTEWVDSFASRNSEILDVFNLGLTTNLWNLSTFIDKNPLKDNTFYQLSLFLGVVDLIKSKNITNVYINMNSPQTAFVDLERNKERIGISIESNVFLKPKEPRRCGFPYFVYWFLRNLYTHFYRVMYFKLLKVKKRLGKDCTALAVTYFPFIDKKQLLEGTYFNTHYKKLQDSLEKGYGPNLGWLAMPISTSGDTFKGKLSMAAEIKNTGTSFDIVDEWNTIGDILKAFVVGIRMHLRMKKAENIFKRFAFWIEGKDRYAVSEVFANSLRESASGFHVMEATRLLFAFQRIKENTSINEIIYFYEFQPWERALCSVFPNEIKIGIQHTIAPYLLTCYSRGRRENGLPLPEYIGCVGEMPKKVMKDGGFESNELFTLGAFRFDKSSFESVEKVEWDKKNKKILVALTISREESEDTIEFVDKAMHGRNIEVVFKPHPALKLTAKSIQIINSSNRYKLEKRSLEDLCAECKCMIVTESSSTFYALAAGIPVVVARIKGYLDLNPLSWVGVSSLIIVDSYRNMYGAVENIMNSNVNPLDQAVAKQILDSYLYFPKSESEYWDNIYCKINNSNN